MKRREFFKVAVGLAGAVVLPAVAAEQTAIAWFEENFDCRMGKPYKFVEGPRGKTEYDTYALGAPVFVSEAKLIEIFLGSFKDTLVAHPELRGARLYWRLKEKIQTRTQRGFDEFFDVQEDGGIKPRIVWRDPVKNIRTRIAVPALQALEHTAAGAFLKSAGGIGVVL